MEGDVGVTAPAESAAYTVTVEDAPDVCVSAVVALSVTFNSKLYVSPAVRVLAVIEQISVAPAAAPMPLLTVH
jgi:hypothetical protein